MVSAGLVLDIKFHDIERLEKMIETSGIARVRFVHAAQPGSRLRILEI